MTQIASWAFLGLAVLFLARATVTEFSEWADTDGPVGSALIGIACVLIAGVLRMP